MSEMVERVARAIIASWNDNNPTPIAYDDLPAWSRDLALKQARDMIAAMRELTEDMAETGAMFTDAEGAGTLENAKSAWREMIDEALK